MEMVLKCVLKNMEDANRHIDALGRQISRMNARNKRNFALALLGTGIAVCAYIRERELEERVSRLEEMLEEIEVSETYEEEMEE